MMMQWKPSGVSWKLVGLVESTDYMEHGFVVSVSCEHKYIPGATSLEFSSDITLWRMHI